MERGMKKLIMAVCAIAAFGLSGCAYHPYRYGYYGNGYYGDRYNGYYGRDRNDGYYGDRYGYRGDDGYYGRDGRTYRDYDR